MGYYIVQIDKLINLITNLRLVMTLVLRKLRYGLGIVENGIIQNIVRLEDC